MKIYVKCPNCSFVNEFSYLKKGDSFKCKQCGFIGIVNDENIRENLEENSLNNSFVKNNVDNGFLKDNEKIFYNLNDSLIITNEFVYSNYNLVSLDGNNFAEGTTIIPVKEISGIGFFTIKNIKLLIISIILFLLAIISLFFNSDSDGFNIFFISLIFFGIFFLILFNITMKKIFIISSSSISIGIKFLSSEEKIFNDIKKALGKVM